MYEINDFKIEKIYPHFGTLQKYMMNLLQALHVYLNTMKEADLIELEEFTPKEIT